VSRNSVDHWLDLFDQDPLFMLEMEASARWGVYHGQFMDWPADEQAKCLALIVWEKKSKSERCSMCGTKPDEWLDENGRVVVPPPYVAEWENCEGCSSIGRREKDREKQDDMPKGMRVVLQPNPEASAEE
jgi:hypothetical protein